MLKTKKDSWFELIPIHAIGDNMIKNEEPVCIVQIEETKCVNDDGVLLMLCELVKE